MTAYRLTPRDRAERAGARLLARLSPRTARRLAGKPIVVDGQTLDPHIQLALKALERMGHSSWSRHGAEVARREVRRAALVNALPVPRVSRSLTSRCPVPPGRWRLAGMRRPAREDRDRSRLSSSSTAAASSSGISTPTTSSAGCSAAMRS